MQPRLTATFPKYRGRNGVATYRWSDGVVATVALHGHSTRLPHDLSHYILESRVLPPYGFWSLAARQAPFSGFTLVEGRWPRGRVEWLERTWRKHHDEMVQAEAVGLDHIASGALDVYRDWDRIRRGLVRGYALTAKSVYAAITQQQIVDDLLPYYREVHDAWNSVPVGGAMQVTWPPTDLVVLDANGKVLRRRPVPEPLPAA